MPSQRKILFSGTAGQLEGVLHLPDAPPRAIAVVAHPLPTMGGTMDNKVVTTLARAFTELGFAALRFNFRGVGESAGSYDEGRGETLDAVAAANFMLGEFGGLPLVMSGFSFGGYVQARAALDMQPRKLVLVAPAVNRFEMSKVPADTLLIHGDQDDVVELDALLQWAHPQHLPIVAMAGAGHFFHGRLTQLRDIVKHHFTGIAL